MRPSGQALVGQAFVLDGAGDFVDVPHDPALNVGAGDFTVDLWVNFNSTAGEQILVEKYVENFSGNAPGWSFAKLANNALVVAPNSPQTPPLSLVPGQWYHFAARRSSGIITIFVNGTPMASGPLGSGGNVNTTSSLKFGHRGSPSDTPGSFDTRGFFLNGRIDEVELFVGRALSDSEILAIFNAGAAGKCKVTVQIDIKPGEFPNEINPSSRGRILVAILTTDATDNVGTFDATTVDPTTVLFGATGTEATLVQDALEEVDGDGDIDMLLQFNTQDTGIECGDTSATLTGQTFDGQGIQGTDSIETVGCK